MEPQNTQNTQRAAQPFKFADASKSGRDHQVVFKAEGVSGARRFSHYKVKVQRSVHGSTSQAAIHTV